MENFVFSWNIAEVCSQGSHWQYLSIDLDTGLAPNRRQAIIWTNADPTRSQIYAALGLCVCVCGGGVIFMGILVT